MNQPTHPQKIIFFDSDCLFCNRWVTIIHRNQKKDDLYFTGLQSSTAKQVLTSDERESLSSMIYLNGENKHLRGSALRALSSELKYPLRFLFLLSWIAPLPLVNLVYQFIASNRYRFTDKPNCSFSADLKEKILS